MQHIGCQHEIESRRVKALAGRVLFDIKHGEPQARIGKPLARMPHETRRNVREMIFKDCVIRQCGQHRVRCRARAGPDFQNSQRPSGGDGRGQHGTARGEHGLIAVDCLDALHRSAGEQDVGSLPFPADHVRQRGGAQLQKLQRFPQAGCSR